MMSEKINSNNKWILFQKSLNYLLTSLLEDIVVTSSLKIAK